jgi:hypothetical protein
MYHCTLLISNLYAALLSFGVCSTAGLGLGFLTTFCSRQAWMLFVASAIDGCTSCMYAIAQVSYC